MELTKSDERIAKLVRKAMKWHKISFWAIVFSSLFFLAMAFVCFLFLQSHLNEHGVQVRNVIQVMCEAEHSSEIQVMLVSLLLGMIQMKLFVGVMGVGSIITFYYWSRERRLLLKLLDNQEEKKTTDHANI